MFAGQGAQYYQMGRELYEQDGAYRAAMDRCDQAAGLIGGQLVSQIVLGRPMADSEHFDSQHESTPALLAVGWSLAQSLFARGLRPDLLLGYSFGETIAATVAGTIPLEDAFRLVADQARLIESTLPRGAMVAILANWTAMAAHPVFAGCELAAVNSPRHFVVSLPLAALPAFTAGLDAMETVYARLPVRYGFHASFIEPAGPGLRALSAGRPRHAPSIPIVSSMSTTLFDAGDPDHFWHVARRPIRFADTIRALEAEAPGRYIEAGPTGTLATFVKQVLGPRTPALPAINQFGHNLRTMSEIAP